MLNRENEKMKLQIYHQWCNNQVFSVIKQMKIYFKLQCVEACWTLTLPRRFFFNFVARAIWTTDSNYQKRNTAANRWKQPPKKAVSSYITWQNTSRLLEYFGRLVPGFLRSSRHFERGEGLGDEVGSCFTFISQQNVVVSVSSTWCLSVHIRQSIRRYSLVLVVDNDWFDFF